MTVQELRNALADLDGDMRVYTEKPDQEDDDLLDTVLQVYRADSPAFVVIKAEE